MSLADALIAAIAEQRGAPLATFDRHFDRLSEIILGQPLSMDDATKLD